eukprot:TRINITY_DN68125_c0_g1_i1.p1 TRINITY_DN68125_c0_g1~~TRINITY_DN68125_c0_g1_i1.p1  ORF type:complete len:443 (-),score=58.16 TRINITY_DN68125_c0_g1_i1:133-1413(-)
MAVFVLSALLSAVRWLWRQWPLVTALWFICAIWVTAALKAATHKGLFSVVGNGLLSSAMLAPLALLKFDTGRSSDASSITEGTTVDSSGLGTSREQQTCALSVKFKDLSALKNNFGLTLLVAVLSGLNRTFTNCTLYFIDAWLKTALSALAVPLTYIVGAMVPGVDESAKDVLAICFCNRRRNNRPRHSKAAWAMVPALVLISVGGVVTSLPQAGPDSLSSSNVGSPAGVGKSYAGYMFGIALQMLSNCAGAAQNVYTKVLLTPPLPNTSQETSGCSVSKSQVALVTQPVIGILGFFSVVFFEHGDFAPPPFGSLLLFSVSVIGILVTELRLVELTSGLTLAVLSASHNVIMVLFFLCLDGEGGDISFMQGLGYAVNTVGCILYASVRWWQQKEEERFKLERNQQHVDVTLARPIAMGDVTSRTEQ